MSKRLEDRTGMLAPGRAPTVQSIVLALVLVCATIAAYAPALQAGFVWDDDYYVTENRHLTEPGGLSRIWIPGNTVQYYPAVFTSFWLERHLWGLDPAGYHAVNVLLHALNGLLVWRCCRKLAIPGAWAIAAVFALHPVHVESVAWVTERKNVLSTCFYLLAFLAWLRFEDAREAPDSRPTSPEPEARGGWGWYGVALIAFLLALLSKTVTCSLPAALILARLWRRRPLRWRALWPLAPMFALGLSLGLHTAHLERTQVGASGPEFDFAFAERFLIAGQAVVFYVSKLAVPWPLAFFYPRWELRPDEIGAYWPLAVIALAFASAVFAWRRGHRGPFLALAFFAGTLFPALGFFDVYPMRYSFVADHFQYLASLGAIAFVVGGIASLWPARWVARFLAPAALAILGSLTARQCLQYEDEETLWRTTIERNPRAWMAHSNLAALLSERGSHEDALASLERAAASAPSRKSAEQIRLNVAIALGKVGRHAEALEIYRVLRESSPGMDLRLALTLERLGRDAEAEASFRQALALGPDKAAVIAFSRHLMRRGRAAEAIEHLDQLAKQDPRDADVFMYLSDACALSGRATEAIANAERALAIAGSRGDHTMVEAITARLAQLRSGRR